MAIPIVCFALFVFIYSVNIPWFDDLEAFVGFLLTYLRADTLTEKWAELLRPNNEHRILFAKLTTVSLYSLTGTLNFRWLIGVAFLCLLGMVAVLYRVFRRSALPALYFLPVLLILLQPQYYGTSVWAITALQHEAVLFFMLTALYWLASGTGGRFGLAILIQLLASFSMGNGLFGWIAGGAILVAQRQYARLGIWIGISVGAILFYFHDYASPQGNESSLSFLLHNPHIVFLGFFTFIGGLFDFFPDAPIFRRSILPTLFGFIVGAGVFVVLKPMVLTFLRTSPQPRSSTFSRQQYFFIGAYALLFVNAAVVAILRPRFGYDVMLVSNYMIYPALLVSLLYLSLLNQTRSGVGQFRWLQIGVIFGGMIWAVSYGRFWPRVAQKNQALQAQAFNQKYNGIGLGATLGTPFARLAKDMMDQAVRTGIYQYPTAFYSPFESQFRTAPVNPDPSLKITVTEFPDHYLIQSPDWYLPAETRRICLVARSDQQTYLFPSNAPFVWSRFYANRQNVIGIQASVLKNALPPGTYRLGFVAAPAETPVRFSDQKLSIQ
ncbi:hypothetical protein GCM10028803_34480 [Larkinella knui]|nr:hypothetical protein [Larkinella knui]